MGGGGGRSCYLAMSVVHWYKGNRCIHDTFWMMNEQNLPMDWLVDGKE